MQVIAQAKARFEDALVEHTHTQKKNAPLKPQREILSTPALMPPMHWLSSPAAWSKAW